MGQIRIGVMVLLMTVTVACDSSSRGEELPPPMLPTRSSEPLNNRESRTWPGSAQVEVSVKYIYETGHCGLTHDLDFDGSFWRAINPNGDMEPPSFFHNYDKGYLTLVSDNRATYEASTGERVDLKRIQGPIAIGGCA